MRTVLFVSFLLGVSSLPAQEFGAAVRTTLSNVRENTEAFKNVKVSFTVQFASIGKISNPFFTKFTSIDFANFYCWADEQPIWQQKSYEDIFGMMFLPKKHDKLETLYSLKLYQRIQITGVIRNTFQNQPWIEVSDFDVLDEQLDTAVLTHLYRGEKFMDQRQWSRAVAELSRAPGEGVPPHAVRTAQKNLGVCMLRMGESASAIGYLESANELSEGTDHEIQDLLAIARSQPELGIDRTVDSKGLKDHERPMWEAFEGDRPATSQPMR